MKELKQCKSIEELKKQYRKLAMQYHPDLGGNAEIMKVLNNQYEQLFEILKDVHNETKNAKVTNEVSNDFIEIINKIINFEGIEIEIIGTWLWIGGKTWIYRNEFKKLGFDWSKKRKLWYWNKDKETKSSYSKASIEQLKDKYGCEKVNSNKFILT